MYSFSFKSLNNSDFKSKIVFQPICGILFSVPNFFTSKSNIPKPLVLPSSENLHINCIPKQTPKTGCFKQGISSSNPASVIFPIAAFA